ncbi:MAG: zinc dependent phospholipase C family protein [Carboxydocellales bacterium]
MFPLTHIYFAEKIWKLVPELPYDSSLLALGCTFPDVVVAGFLEHGHTHQQTNRMVEFFKSRAPVQLTFALGVLTHGSAPPGLDYYGDEQYLDYERGYCFEKARPIINDVIACCRIPEELGWWKAHNFIEMAIEIELGERFPGYQKQLYEAYHDRETINSVGSVLGEFFGKPAIQLVNSLTFFTGLIAIETITATELAQKYSLQVKTKHNIGIDEAGVAAIINHARKLIADDFWQFEQYVTDRLVELMKAHTKT